MARINYQPIVPFDPWPWQIAPWLNRDPIMLLTGGVGGGKSLLAGNKIHAYCLHYPGAMALVMRKVRSTMPNSTIAFLQTSVIGDDPRVVFRPSDFRFDYNNGSRLVWGGMADEKQRQHIRSIGQEGGVDIAWFEEANQFEEDDYDELPGRMRAKASDKYYERLYNDLGDPGRLAEIEYRKYFNEDGSPRLTGWRQIILSTNPDVSGHWINLRMIEGGEATVYRSNALDNPANPPDYIEGLKRLKGVKYDRMVLGLWRDNDKAVFDTWYDALDATGDNGGNVTESAEYIDNGGEVYWWADDGYAGIQDPKTKHFTGRSHPRAFIFVQKRSDGTLVVFDEHYAIGLQAPEHIQEVIEYSDTRNYARPTRVIFPREAVALGGALKKAQLPARYNVVPVEESIKEVREYISADSNHIRRLTLHPRCFHCRHEMGAYSRNPATDKIIKQHDHGPDCIRMGIWDQVHGPASEVQVAILDANGQPVLVPIAGRPASTEKITTQRYGQVVVATLGGAAI